MRKNIQKALTGTTLLVMLAGCSDSNVFDNDLVAQPSPPVLMADFQVTVTNLTNGQPLSPAAIIVHDDDYTIMELGAPASAALELLAESGDNSDLIAAADSNDNVLTTASGMGVIPPGANEVIMFTIEAQEQSEAFISVSTMLVNTNDAITGNNSLGLDGMTIGDSLTVRGRAYDAGTEGDTEIAGSIPGPAGGGEGFNAARDDEIDAIAVHKGVVTSDDDLVTSALNGQHKFDNPVIQIRVERLQ